MLVVGALTAWSMSLFISKELDFEIASFVFTIPAFSVTTLISIGIPLFIVTMSSQNMPGIATMHTAGYKPPLSPIISTTGIKTMLLAPFDGFAFNLAAITAAICMEKDADPNRDTRYLAAVSAGVFYLIAALFGGTVVALFSMSPKALILPLAGLALIGTLGNSLAIALEKPSHREAALVTFLVTVSGVVFFGIGAVFWGLIAGLLVQKVLQIRI